MSRLSVIFLAGLIAGCIAGIFAGYTCAEIWKIEDMMEEDMW